MDLSSWSGAGGVSNLQVLWEDGERVFCRGQRHANGHRAAMLAVLLHAALPTPANVVIFAAECGLREALEDAWAVRPVEIGRYRRPNMLLNGARRSGSLHRLFGPAMEVLSILRLAIAV